MAKDIEKFKERLMTLVNCVDATNKKIRNTVDGWRV